jgi:hypothetical protein
MKYNKLFHIGVGIVFIGGVVATSYLSQPIGTAGFVFALILLILKDDNDQRETIGYH